MSNLGLRLKSLFITATGDTNPAVNESVPTEAASAEVIATPEPVFLAEADCNIEEQKDFSQIYAEHSVVAVSFPAEKLLKLMDGLKAMDEKTRKAAIMAMDAADDTWTVNDCILDAERKTAALQSEKKNLIDKNESSKAHANSKILEKEEEARKNLAAIRQQISDMQALLERETTKAANEKSKIESELASTQSAYERETSRLDSEVVRLKDVSVMFGSV